MRDAVRRDATEESATQSFNAPADYGGKRKHMTLPTPYRASARDVAHVLSPAK